MRISALHGTSIDVRPRLSVFLFENNNCQLVKGFLTPFVCTFSSDLQLACFVRRVGSNNAEYVDPSIYDLKD